MSSAETHATLAFRERFRDAYWDEHDPIADERLLWRAQTFRHTVHLLPGQRILELGSGSGRFTRVLRRVTRAENPLTCVRFSPCEAAAPEGVEVLVTDDLPRALKGREFERIVGMDLLDARTAEWLLPVLHEHLTPGGQVIFYESNPWNVVLRLRNWVSRLAGHPDERALLDKPRLYELLSEIGFIRVFAVFNDFLYRPLTGRLTWPLRNLTILLENAPLVQTLAGSILLHAQKPPRQIAPPRISLFRHEALRDAVSVVVPCHDEEDNLRPLVERILTLYGEYVHEIVLVDDNSKDGTAEVIRALAHEEPRVRGVFRTPPNGVGRALADGLAAARGRWILTSDCDFQHLLPEFRDLFDAAAEGCDVAVGSRFTRHSVLLNYPFTKILANRGFHLLAQLLLWRRFNDLTNNLKLMRREVVDDLRLREPGFAVNAEIGLQPLLSGHRVREVPISWINRTPGMGTSSFRLAKVGTGYWRALLGLVLANLFDIGPYRGLPRRGTKRSTLRERPRSAGTAP